MNFQQAAQGGTTKTPEELNASMDQMMDFATGLPGMPSTRAMGADMEPTPEEMAKQAEAARYEKHVNITGIDIRTFDLSSPEAVKEYRELYIDLYGRASKREVVIVDRQKKFIEDGERSRWIIHLEWLEYELEVKDHMNKKSEETKENA